MKGKIRVRFPNEIWWDEISFEQALDWNQFEVTYLGESTCFVKIDGQSFELERNDYDLILDHKAFRLKFDLKKHTFKF